MIGVLAGTADPNRSDCFSVGGRTRSRDRTALLFCTSRANTCGAKSSWSDTTSRRRGESFAQESDEPRAPLADRPVVVNDHYTLLHWLMQRVEQYPRGHRFTLDDRKVNLALDVLERLLETTYSKSKWPS